MKKLLQQFIKFGLVGFLCFFIDFGIFKLVVTLLRLFTDFAYCDVIANVCSFSVSVIVNYYLSMKYVFARNEDMDRKKEFFVFVVLSIIGGILNTAIIWLIDHPIYNNVALLQQYFANNLSLLESIAKVIATGFVTIYNFVSRKLLLEDKSKA